MRCRCSQVWRRGRSVCHRCDLACTLPALCSLLFVSRHPSDRALQSEILASLRFMPATLRYVPIAIILAAMHLCGGAASVLWLLALQTARACWEQHLVLAKALGDKEAEADACLRLGSLANATGALSRLLLSHDGDVYDTAAVLLDPQATSRRLQFILRMRAWRRVGTAYHTAPSWRPATSASL